MNKKRTAQRSIKPYLHQFYKGNIGYLVLAVISMLILTLTNLVISWLLQQIVDLISGSAQTYSFEILLLIGVGCFGTVLLSFVVDYFSRPKFTAKALESYKNYIYDKLSQKSILAFNGENTSLYISALSNDINSIEKGYLSNLFTIILQSFLFVGGLLLMLYYSPLLTLISVLLAILPLLASLLTGGMVAKAEKKVSDQNEKYMSLLNDSLLGFSVIKSFRAEKQLCQNFAKQVKAVSNAKEFRLKLQCIVQALGAATSLILQLGIFFFGAYLALSGSSLSAGSVLIFVQLLNFVIQPISLIPQAFAEIRSSKALICKLDAALSNNIRCEGYVTKSTLTKAITLKNLSFSYEKEKPILTNLNFRFEAGKSYCLVGASGSGKSTLLNLLMASSENYNGQILYDDTPLEDIADNTLYEMISQIQQNVFVFNASIYDNITMFNNFPKEAVDLAIKKSGMLPIIEKHGLDHICAENGSDLSGGEKQRIAIARALLKHSDVLLVDEATAALDAETTYQVTSSILDLNGLTRIVISHGLDAGLLRRYDEILVLNHGTIIEHGHFDELLDQKGYFYSLYTIAS